MEVLLDIRREMAHEVDYDTDLFAEMIRSGRHTTPTRFHSLVPDYEKPAGPGEKAAPKKR
ncbi:MAG: hypothetical protein ABI857_05795 [Acidobacteriota bacterium]